MCESFLQRKVSHSSVKKVWVFRESYLRGVCCCCRVERGHRWLLWNDWSLAEETCYSRYGCMHCTYVVCNSRYTRDSFWISLGNRHVLGLQGSCCPVWALQHILYTGTYMCSYFWWLAVYVNLQDTRLGIERKQISFTRERKRLVVRREYVYRDLTRWKLFKENHYQVATKTQFVKARPIML